VASAVLDAGDRDRIFLRAGGFVVEHRQVMPLLAVSLHLVVIRTAVASVDGLEAVRRWRRDCRSPANVSAETSRMRRSTLGSVRWSIPG
jgi:hypothetical protein